MYYQVSRLTRRLSLKSALTTFRTFNTKIQPQHFNSEKILPDELVRKVVSLKCPSTAEGGICNVYLVGTYHHNPKSCDLVRDVITSVKPQVVFLEYPSDLAWHFECKTEPELAKASTVREMMEMWKRKMTRSVSIQVQTVREIIIEMWKRKMTLREIISTYMEAKRKQSNEQNEFFVAHREAAQSGAKVILGDLSEQILMRRLHNKMPHSKVVSSFEIMGKGVHCRVDDDVDFDQIAKYNQLLSEALPPDFVDVFLHGRNKHMSSELLKVANKHESVVAVVGFGHLPGIKTNMEQSIQVDGQQSVVAQSA